MPERSRITMSEVAAAAGVSVPTVSKVVNGRPDVSKDTRERVEKLLRLHAYRPRTGRTQPQTGLIELVFLDLASPWVMRILAGVEKAAHQAGVGVVVAAVHGRSRARPERQWLEQLDAHGSGGVLLVLSEMSELSAVQRAEVADLSTPVVIVDPGGQPDPAIPSVGATNWTGGLAATEHLIDRGHQRIAVIGGPAEVLCSRARLDGYRTAMRAAGLKIRPGYERTGDFTSASGYRETLALLDLSSPPTAVFACADEMARGVYEALYERGLRVPDDISIVGFDDLEEARWAIPPLTTVRQPLTEMAGMATRMLLSLVNVEELDTTRVELTTPLVVRFSTAPPAIA